MIAFSPYLSVADLGKGFRDGSFTPLDVCKASLERLYSLEPQLNAFIDPLEDFVLTQAEAATAELAAGNDKGPLHGVPVAIKDIIDIAGIPTSYATKAVAPHIASTNALAISRLKAAGAILFGKTNLLEFAYGIVHPDFGQTNNPYSPDRTAGGSSGGSAAAVAAGIVPLALGTDTGGSIRAPASYCGITGLKPSFGALPLDGVFPLAQSLDHLGVLARSVENASLAFVAMAASPKTTSRETRPLRIGLVESQWNSKSITEDIRSTLDTSLDLIRQAGHQIIPVELADPQEMATALLDILLPEAALVHEEIHASNPDGYAQGTRQQIELGKTMPAIPYLRAKAVQQTLKQDLQALFERVDLILTPTVPFVAPDSDPALSAEGDDEILFLSHADLTGAPCISLNCGLSVPPNGKVSLPVGIQLTGAIGSDVDFLNHCRTIEASLSTACGSMLSSSQASPAV
nr:amidase [uncultured Cohaesibacter sp.]